MADDAEPYDATDFDPPAPVARVVLRPLDGGAATGTEASLLIDTGADTTLLPRRLVEQLGVPTLEDASYALVAFDGSTSIAPAADLEVVFLGRTYQGRYLLIDDERGILGRDVLNHVAILLRGPEQLWSSISR